MTGPLLLSVDAAAVELLGWTPDRLRKAIQRGQWKAGVVRNGRSVSISRPAVLRYLETVGLEDVTE